MPFYIYKITNNINKKVYIGKSNSPFDRIKKHLYVAAHKDTASPHQFQPIHSAILKYGTANFTFEIIDNSEIEDEIFEKEKFWIANYKSNISRYGDKFGYNLTDGGEGNSGRSLTLESKNKISKANSGKNNGMYEYIESFKNRKIRGLKISETKKNKNKSTLQLPISNETIEKLKQAVKEKASQKLTDNQKDEIIILYKSGKFIKRQLAEKFSVEEKTIQYVLRHWEEVKNNKLNYLTNLEKQNIINLYLTKNYTKKEIANITNIAFNRVEAVIKTYQVKIRDNKLV